MVLSPEYEDPDRDDSKQTDPRDQPPTPLYGAEDVLNAQVGPPHSSPAGRGRPFPTQYTSRRSQRGEFGFPSKLRILPSVIAAQYEVGQSGGRYGSFG